MFGEGTPCIGAMFRIIRLLSAFRRAIYIRLEKEVYLRIGVSKPHPFWSGIAEQAPDVLRRIDA